MSDIPHKTPIKRLSTVARMTISMGLGILSYLISSSYLYDFLTQQKKANNIIASVGTQYISPLIGAATTIITAGVLKIIYPTSPEDTTPPVRGNSTESITRPSKEELIAENRTWVSRSNQKTHSISNQPYLDR